MSIAEQISELQKQVEVLKAANAEELENLRLKYMSKKGAIPQLFEQFKAVPKEEKATLGASINQLRQMAEARFADLREQLGNMASIACTDKLDLTRTPDPIELGTRHPLSLVREEIIDIFSHIGFTVADGPEVEDDEHVFSLLNFAPEHPARDMQDTFFIEKEEGVQQPTDILLRTHTSSVQTRVMTSQKPPIRFVLGVCIGMRPFRHVPTASSIKLKACILTKMSVLQTYVRRYCISPKKCSVQKRKYVCVQVISHLQNQVQKWI